MFQKIGFFFFGVGLFALAACGSGSSSGTSSGSASSALEVAEKVSVVDASSSSTSASVSRSVGKILAAVAKASPPSAGSSSDWNNDTTKTFVFERSTESFDTINEILCNIAQTQYDQKLNAGNYKALIDITQCDNNRDSANSAGQSSQNQSSGSTMTQYSTWTANSSRVSDTSPQIVEVWIHEDASDFDPAKIICAKLTITETVSATNPYGIFTANFAAYPEADGCTGTPFFKGFLKTEKQAATGKVLLKFAVDGGFSEGGKTFSFNERAVLDRSASGTSGTGTIAMSNSFEGNTKNVNFDIAFNSTHFLRNDGTCLDRNNFNETAWRYGLYSAAGSRITRSSGFPIRYASGGKSCQGWVGYWGVWLPGG
ncbi:MAG TPA: hypothetical protein VI874_00370, partial [Candidatus Norongarragalinales archaeon]|nr:hypothetical protein [Candidatus Norongarragalinales archaeon]